jgi:acetyltransferase-like isoleucine patch superfamily enzyme
MGDGPVREQTAEQSTEKALQKASARDELRDEGKPALKKYADFFVGRPGVSALATYELYTVIGSLFPGALGYLARKLLYRRLLGRCGGGVQFGRNVALRHPAKMHIGSGTAIDDDCMLDARGSTAAGFVIGERVLIARACLIQSKVGSIEIGDECSIGGQSTLSASGGIRLGKYVNVAGQCYIGGGRYHTDRTGVPMMKQGIYSRGPVVVADDVWVGAGARLLDGVHVGEGAIIGAGAIVAKDIPAYAIAAGVPAKIVGWRE